MTKLWYAVDFQITLRVQMEEAFTGIMKEFKDVEGVWFMNNGEPVYSCSLYGYAMESNA
jgi:hypothetical protein